MNLNNLNVKELNLIELTTIEGGRRRPSWEQIKKWGTSVLTAIESIDIAERFMKGWNSHEC